MGRRGRAPIGPKTRQVAESPAPVVESARDAVPQEWWRDLKEDDPITLEPLADLDVPPFGIPSDGATHYFDAVALASYITRRAVFQNPLNRRPLSREDCVRLDEHIQVHALGSRNFRVADAFALQLAIRDRIASSGDRSAASLRRDATAALQGHFSYPSLQAAGSLAAARGDGGWAVVDDDFQRHIEAEAIAALHAAAAAEAARPGGAVPEASAVNFPGLSEEAAVAGERLAAMVHEGDGYSRAAQAMADEAAREARRRAAEEADRRAAAKEAAARAEVARRAAISRALETQREREAREAESAIDAAAHLAELRKQKEKELAEALRRKVIEGAAAAEQREAVQREETLKRAEEEKREDEEQIAAKRCLQEEERRAEEERKKEREAEKKRRQKEKKRLEKEKAAAEQAKLELEAAKLAASLKCALCGEGIIGKNFFEVNGQKFCSTACVKKNKTNSTS